MKMFYKICRIINMVVSCFIMLIIFFGLFVNDDSETGTIIVAIVAIFLIAIFFLAFDFICGKLYKYNKEQISLTSSLKNKGKIFFVLNLLAGLAICLIGFAAFPPFLSSSANKTLQKLIIHYSLFSIFILAGITAFINLFFFGALLRKNKIITTGIITDIGKYN